MGCGGSSQNAVKEFRNPEANTGYRATTFQNNQQQQEAASSRKENHGYNASYSASGEQLNDKNKSSTSSNSRTALTSDGDRACSAKALNDEPLGYRDANSKSGVKDKSGMKDHNANDGGKGTCAPVGDEHDFEGKPEPFTESRPQVNTELNNKSTEVDDDTESFAELDLIPLEIPQVDEAARARQLTVDDINDHNIEVASADWFCYAKGVYARSLIVPIVLERMDQCILKQDPYRILDAATRLNEGYPIYTLRRFGISRRILAELLPAVQVGVRVHLAREEYLWRFKQSAEDVKESLHTYSNLSFNENDFLDQISRWLDAFPNVNAKNVAPSSPTGNANDAEFPISEKFMIDPTLLRRWTETWVQFDVEVPADGAWNMLPQVNDTMGDTHELFSQLVAERSDSTFADLDLEIDGVVAWNVIEIDVVKNDITTEEQDKIIKSRERRNDLFDKERMRSRRLVIAEQMRTRHNQRVSEENFSNSNTLSDSYMVEYLGWAERLEKHWQEFQKLCEKEFVPPKRSSPPSVGHVQSTELNSAKPSDSIYNDDNAQIAKPSDSIYNDDKAQIAKPSDSIYNDDKAQQESSSQYSRDVHNDKSDEGKSEHNKENKDGIDGDDQPHRYTNSSNIQPVSGGASKDKGDTGRDVLRLDTSSSNLGDSSTDEFENLENAFCDNASWSSIDKLAKHDQPKHDVLRLDQSSTEDDSSRLSDVDS